MAESQVKGIRFGKSLENEVLLLMRERRVSSFSEAVKQMVREHKLRRDFSEGRLKEIKEEIKNFGFTPDRVFPELKRHKYMGKEMFSRELKE